MKCASCKNDTTIESLTSYFSHGPGGYIIIEHVPCRKCTQCGEEFFSASVMERIDEILAGLAPLPSKVQIMEYVPAA
ncbi:MAG: type II toxin-antitoxin system MqsA family antitoxin [Spirochaetaceae bacterium]|nr:type II toxin-antitoxin system MqsA family antitoxin [Spirochaetaceae bacterium]MBQ7366061.1 type II toxin-antitoxin system MqsA family antitoxin [Spirochaetaceae bacterium]MBQ8561255.1 type II toxin-antitoxin system MqsA family antitoxin [Spirochaetaceae bacterium]